MDSTDNAGLREVEQVVVALNVLMPIDEPPAPESCLVKAVVLNHGADSAVEDDYSLR